MSELNPPTTVATNAPRRAESPASSALRVWPKHILIATDGSHSADAAVAAAGALGERSGASVELAVIYASRTPLPPCPDRSGLQQCEGSQRIDVAGLLRSVRRQRHRLAPGTPWPLRCDVGDPPTLLGRIAEQYGADVVVMGIGPEEPADRVYGSHTALRAIRFLEVPLYAVARGCEGPTRGIVVLPDGQVHAPTVRAAVGCLPPGATLWIAVPSGALLVGNDDEDSSWLQQTVVPASVHDVGRQLGEFSVHRLAIEDDMFAGVLRVAEQLDAQLLAVPNRGDPGPVRVFLPNLAEPLLVSAHCSVLVVPDDRPTGS